ncbi:Hypothetical predicted protein [Podarcis lilfordi]|uniref:Snake toxin/toxin-like domain-containing protein n=1 Tax=Podarcis lilfordi TaxID=74358 RepID=A0AA35PRU8_9SAUR|nr:Hypothetical predicted protein [Podarcis lilfordi]
MQQCCVSITYSLFKKCYAWSFYYRMITGLGLLKAGAITCIECKHVAEDNSCMVPETQCSSPSQNICFTRLTTQDGVSPIVDRGCTHLCHSIKRPRENYQETMRCCMRDLCNTHSFWTNH